MSSVFSPGQTAAASIQRLQTGFLPPSTCCLPMYPNGNPIWASVTVIKWVSKFGTRRIASCLKRWCCKVCTRGRGLINAFYLGVLLTASALSTGLQRRRLVPGFEPPPLPVLHGPRGHGSRPALRLRPRSASGSQPFGRRPRQTSCPLAAHTWEPLRSD